MPQGRIMVNCGGAHAEVSGSGDGTANMNGSWIQNSTIKALCQAFPGKVCCFLSLYTGHWFLLICQYF